MTLTLEEVYYKNAAGFKSLLGFAFNDFYFLYEFIALLIVIDVLAICVTLLAVCFYKIHICCEKEYEEEDSNVLSEKFENDINFEDL
jgi:hypothetical protein